MNPMKPGARARRRCTLDEPVKGPLDGETRCSSRRRPWVLLIALTGTWTQPALAQNQPVAVAFDGRQTMLVFMAPDEAEQVLASQRPATIDPRSPAESEVIKRCTQDRASSGVLPKGLFTTLEKQAVNFVLAQVSERVRREIDEYSAMFTQTASIDYFAAMPASSASTGGLQARHSCLRFAQADLDASGSVEVGFDFVAAIGIAESNDAVLLQPLRLYVGRSAAKSKDRSFGVALGIRADAVWRDQTRGLKETIWDEVVLTEGVELAGGPALRYFSGVPDLELRLPMPPVSVGVDTSEPYGRIDVTMTGAQVGALPTTLDLLGDMLLPTRDRTAGLIYLAAAARGKPPGRPRL